MTELFRRAVGYVEIGIKGGCPERFISECSAAGVKFWDVVETPDGITAKIRVGNYRRVRAPRRRYGVKLRVLARRGLPFYIAKHKRRVGVLLGAAAFFAILWVMSQFIWDIQISGNNLITDAELLDSLSRCGVSVGMAAKKVDPDQTAALMLLDDPDLAWVALNRRGTTVYVELTERVLPPDMLPSNHPCNVISNYTGLLISLQVYSGVPNALVGEGVARGQVLISGVVTDREGAVRLLHARGKAVAEIRLADSVSVALKSEYSEPSQQVKVRYELSLFGLKIPLSFDRCEANEYTVVTENKLTLFGNKYPLSLIKREYRDKVTVCEELTPIEAEEKAKALLETRLAELADGAEVKNREYAVINSVTGVTVSAVYICVTEIGIENEIFTE